MAELRHILNGLEDTTRLHELQRYFEEQALAVRLVAEGVRLSQARAAELTARLEAWRASLKPSRTARNIKIMRLVRRGLSDDDIGKRCSCSGRTVRRVVARTLGRPRGAR